MKTIILIVFLIKAIPIIYTYLWTHLKDLYKRFLRGNKKPTN